MIYRVNKFRLIFMNAMVALIGLACLGASIAQVVAWTRMGSAGVHGGGLVVLFPVFALMAYWGARGLLTMRGKDLRLEADAEGVIWVHMRGKNQAKWTSLDAFRIDSRRKVVMATVTGPDVSPNVAASGVFTLSAQSLDMDETDLAGKLNALRRRAVGET